MCFLCYADLSNKTYYIYTKHGKTIYAEEYGDVLLSETQKTAFSFQPCLANVSEENCYSLVAVSDKTFYIRTIGAGLAAHSTDLSPVQNDLVQEASFQVHDSPVEGGFLLFESFSNPGYFITSNDDGMLFIAKRNNGSCFQDTASSFTPGLPTQMYLGNMFAGQTGLLG